MRTLLPLLLAMLLAAPTSSSARMPAPFLSYLAGRLAGASGWLPSLPFGSAVRMGDGDQLRESPRVLLKCHLHESDDLAVRPHPHSPDLREEAAISRKTRT